MATWTCPDCGEVRELGFMDKIGLLYEDHKKLCPGGEKLDEPEMFRVVKPLPVAEKKGLERWL